MKATGTLKVKMDTQRISDRFQKREFVVTIAGDGGEPIQQHVSFQLQQENCSIINNLVVGENVIVEFELKGREWNGPQGIKYFNTLEALTVEKV